MPYAYNPRNNDDAVKFVANSIRKFEKMSHFKADTLAKAVVKAKARGKDSSDATDKWLKRNQKKYGYRFTHYQD